MDVLLIFSFILIGAFILMILLGISPAIAGQIVFFTAILFIVLAILFK